MARNILPISLAFAGQGPEPHQTERSHDRHSGTQVSVYQHDHGLDHNRQQDQSKNKASGILVPVCMNRSQHCPSITDVMVQSKNCPIVIPVFTVSVNTLSSTDSTSLYKYPLIQVLFYNRHHILNKTPEKAPYRKKACSSITASPQEFSPPSEFGPYSKALFHKLHSSDPARCTCSKYSGQR